MLTVSFRFVARHMPCLKKWKYGHQKNEAVKGNIVTCEGTELME